MTAMRSIRICAQWLDNGGCLLWSEPYMRPSQLLSKLFAYHQPSYYGTLIPTEPLAIREVIKLPVRWAVDYWIDLPVNRHIEWSWDEEAQRSMRIAPLVRRSLQEGWIIPDYDKWRRGGSGFRIDWSRLLEAQPELKQEQQLTLDDRLLADRWGSQLIVAYLTDSEIPLEERNLQLPGYERYVSAYRSMQGMVRQDWMREEDWLHVLGYEQEQLPFRLALRLSEPDASGRWQLSIIVQGRQDPAVTLTCSTLGDVLEGSCPMDFQPLLKERIYRETRKITSLVHQLSDPNDPNRMQEHLDDEGAWLFLMEWSSKLIEHGVSVLLPSWWEQIRRAKPKLRTRILAGPGPVGGGMVGLEQLLAFDWRVSIGDLELTEEEYMQLLSSGKHLVSIRGRWIAVDQNMLQSIQKRLRRYRREGGIPLYEVLEYGLLRDASRGQVEEEEQEEESVVIEMEFAAEMERYFNQLRRIHKPSLIPIPSGLKGHLRPYQHEGVSWLVMLRRLGFGGCLADDMGLGKTVQWIAYLLHILETEHPKRPSLLICPTSVLGNWQKEFERFAPDLKIHLHHGPARLKGDAFIEAALDSDVVLTSYALASLDRDQLRLVRWETLCLDEAQNIKNAYTKQAQAIRYLRAGHRVALTGTPLENRLSELWSIMNFVNPGYLGSLHSFDRFARQAERQQDEEGIRKVQAIVRPFLLRREKNDPAISLNLPSKQEIKCYVTLSPEQSVLYEQQLDILFRRIDSLHAMERRGTVLATITKLKQLCDHPALLTRQFDKPVDELLEQSHKLMRLTEMVEEVREANERCIIFTQYIEMGKLLQKVLSERLQEKVMFMHGGVSKAERDLMIASFQQARQDEPRGVFILSLKTGGTGLNLTSANHVFHYDRWWNPAVENQASDRVYRIGQERAVFVHKFISIGTLEEKIDEMLERKLGLSSKIVGSGEQWIGELTNEELREILELRRV